MQTPFGIPSSVKMVFSPPFANFTSDVEFFEVQLKISNSKKRLKIFLQSLQGAKFYIPFSLAVFPGGGVVLNTQINVIVLHGLLSDLNALNL